MISGVMAVALTAVMGVVALKDAPPGAPASIRLLTNTNPTPVLKATPKTSQIFVAHPYAIMVLVPGRMDPGLFHGGQLNSGKDDCVEDPHYELVPRN